MVQAAPAADYLPWLTGSYPEPIDPATGLPAFVPFEEVMSPLSGTKDSSKVLTNGDGNHVAVKVTDGPTQSGSIWSTYTLDLTKSFDARMNLYFNSGTDLGDGMAFVMSGAKPTQVYGIGSALGIWRSQLRDGAKMAALPKSFAIAFDTTDNHDRQDHNVVQKGAGQYVGWGYPAQPNQSAKSLGMLGTGLEDLPIQWASGNSYGDPGLGGYQALDNAMTDGTWHPLHIHWEAAGDGGGTFSFQFAVGSEVVDQSLTWSQDDVARYFDGTTVYWGFTGTAGAYVEDAVVAFQSIPGVLDNGMTAEVTQGTVYPRSVLSQDYTITYDPNASLQAWPQPSGGQQSALYAQLLTGSHYGFVVANDGNIHLDLGGGKELLADIPAGEQPGDITDRAGNSVRYVNKIALDTVPPFPKNMTVQTLKFSAPIIAREVGGAETVSAGTVIGNNGQATANVSLPAVVPEPLTLDAVPSFKFGEGDAPKITVGELIDGLNAKPGIASGNISAAIPDGATNRLTAKMASFQLGPGYQAGSAHLAFSYNGAIHTLTDNNSETELFNVTGSQLPDGTVSNPTLTIAPYAHATVGVHKSCIEWTLTSSPPMR
ncbi:hypothetical protein FC75_GL001250 [Lacticaseibacillus camelliae DSM 22697 = JCM 13995]|uniref:WxL domain-containing protein n=2 Tax=Lacticaseibacillus camelliae TaxID=381742 RepID=A0A0R2F7V0_9LACO|nr:hypothetical protein FC75_GL001250 [Lacticaseibacillus camelliae DSM 22697 = JCM 13995]